MAVKESEGRLADPVPRQVVVAGAGQLHVLHLDSGRAQGGHQAPRLLDRHHVVLVAVDHQKRSRAARRSRITARRRGSVRAPPGVSRPAGRRPRARRVVGYRPRGRRHRPDRQHRPRGWSSSPEGQWRRGCHASPARPPADHRLTSHRRRRASGRSHSPRRGHAPSARRAGHRRAGPASDGSPAGGIDEAVVDAEGDVAGPGELLSRVAPCVRGYRSTSHHRG